MKGISPDAVMGLLTAPNLVGLAALALTLSSWVRLPHPIAYDLTMWYLPPVEVITGIAVALYFRRTSESLIMVACRLVGFGGILIGTLFCIIMIITFVDVGPHF